MYRLVFQPRDAHRPPFTGDATTLTIGRADGCGLRLPDLGVRDQHAVIERRPDGYFLRDLTNSRSVHVNHQAVVADQRLATGDELEVGAVRFIFEVLHDPPPGRRALDPWQIIAILAVAGLMAGQLGLFVWIFLQPHPRGIRTDIIRGKAARKQAAEAATQTLPPTATAPALVPLDPPAPVAPPPPTVLGQRIKITRIDRTDPTTLRITLKAQVGDRQLENSAVKIVAQFYDAANQLTGTQTLPTPPSWENFASKQLFVHCATPASCAGYVVRTYYRNQLQDVRAEPTALATRP